MGHGDANAPAGGFSAEAQRLVDAGTEWDGIATALSEAQGLVTPNRSIDGLFGAAAELSGVSTSHSNFNTRMVEALGTGSATATVLADGLVETANDYSNTDTSTAANFGTV